MTNFKYLQKLFFLLVMGFSLSVVQACGEDDDEKIVDDSTMENGDTVPSDSISDSEVVPSDSTIISTDSIRIEAVDLGLSVKWAPCNVGATDLNLHGSYFAWGEIAEKPEYTYDNCSTYKRNLSNISGNKLYDAASANWGDGWRLPTKAEIQELLEYCNWTWTNQGIFEGYLVTSYTTGQSIFIPATGCRYENSLNGAGTECCYWTSSPIEGNDSLSSYCFHFESRKYRSGSRYYGYCVRPVKGEIERAELPIFDCIEIFDLNTTEVTFSGLLYYDGDSPIIECGFCMDSTSEEPTVDNRKVVSVPGNRNFYGAFDELTPNTTYHARAYVINSKGIRYSGTLSFTTPSLYVPHEAVDLGLSVKWATCNVGAASPEKYGDYYAWGETETKKSYDSDSYKQKDYNSYDRLTSLEPDDDVATVKWGSKWRMPDYGHFRELVEQCTWTWTTQNGINGQIVTGPNGNSIFLPAAGYRDGTGINGRGNQGRYWSNYCKYDSYGYVYYLYFRDDDEDYNYTWYRVCGLTVRPVCN